jgi:L,D-transpeptidase catalytic domain
VQGLVAGKVLISLHGDRTKAGTLVLTGANGETLFSCHCLGRSAGHASNPSRDPMKYRGNTPVGKYALTSISHLPKPVVGIGSLWCPLDPDDFYDTQARRAEIGGRHGLGIHAGRGNLVLKATHGCVRLLDRDMADFARIAGKLRFTVEIVEAA